MGREQYKMYTSGSKTNSQRILTEINKNAAMAKIKISVENDTVKSLKTFRIISSEMLVSPLIIML